MSELQLPAAQAWVRTAIDARRYIDENAADIYVRINGQNFALAALPTPVRQMYIVRFMDRWHSEKWLPYTKQDAAAAFAKAEAAGLDVFVVVDGKEKKP